MRRKTCVIKQICFFSGVEKVKNHDELHIFWGEQPSHVTLYVFFLG